MRILVGTNLFHPLYGGGEKALIEWLVDLQKRDIDICVITTVPEIEGLEKDFPFEVIRMSKKIPYEKSIDENGLHNYVQGLHYDYEQLSNKGIEIIQHMPPFDYYIGYGMWGSEWVLPHYQSFAMILKERFPYIRTISLKWDVHGGEGNYDTDYVLHGAPYKYIKNPHYPMDSIHRFSIYPKQTAFEVIEEFNFEEWKEREYDFIFNNPQLNKGSITVLKLAQHYKNLKFLVKLGNWGSWDNNEIRELEKLDNVDIISQVTSMEHEFYRKGKYLLSPGIIDGGGMMPLEAAMQGTIPLCSDIGILRYSSAPFAEFVYSDEVGYNALDKMYEWNGYDKLNFDEVVKEWVQRIDFLNSNSEYVEDIYLNLKFVENFVKERYLFSLNQFIQQLEEINR